MQYAHMRGWIGFDDTTFCGRADFKEIQIFLTFLMKEFEELIIQAVDRSSRGLFFAECNGPGAHKWGASRREHFDLERIGDRLDFRARVRYR